MSSDTASVERYDKDAEVEAIVRDFEACVLPEAQFDHRLHLTVAFHYLAHLSDAQAHERMRASLRRYIKHHGGDPQVYNETITLFWLKRVRRLMRRLPASYTVAGAANAVIEHGGSARLIFDYYSREVLLSDAARTSWVEPDLMPLDF